MPTYNVNQLIQRLKKFPREWKVVLVDSEVGGHTGIKDLKGDQEAKQVVISETYLD